jgi:hypothetical protein
MQKLIQDLNEEQLRELLEIAKADVINAECDIKLLKEELKFRKEEQWKKKKEALLKIGYDEWIQRPEEERTELVHMAKMMLNYYKQKTR